MLSRSEEIYLESRKRTAKEVRWSATVQRLDLSPRGILCRRAALTSGIWIDDGSTAFAKNGIETTVDDLDLTRRDIGVRIHFVRATTLGQALTEKVNSEQPYGTAETLSVCDGDAVL